MSDDDLNTLLAKRKRFKPDRMTWILLVLVAMAIGFVLGALTQRIVSSGVGQPTMTGDSSVQAPSGSKSGSSDAAPKSK